MEFQLRKLRKQRGLTQEDVALGINTTKKRVGDWERQGNIKLDDACKIADFLDVSLDELAGRWEYVGQYADDRQRRMNEAYAYLDDSQKDSALGSIEGMAAMQARKKAGSQGPKTTAKTA